MKHMEKMNLTTLERKQLLSAACSQTVRAADTRRARLILMLDDGETREAIMQRLRCDSRFISRWSSRFLAERLAGLYARHPGRAPVHPPEKLEARVLNLTLKHRPPDGSTHWSSYKLAAALGDVGASTVQRIWRKHGVRPVTFRHKGAGYFRHIGACRSGQNRASLWFKNVPFSRRLQDSSDGPAGALGCGMSVRRARGSRRCDASGRA